ncbi:hypothetical protein BDK88_2136 [Natrinema hispanicum]|uniref:Uncharacterized protein n=1 Tax=Natrinema hispanicum TaxID=392421 RepID=A0A482YB30_9EURY|nr:hypothetical protein BDK88_2136 [Natrinema hispanicum]
MLTPEAIVAEIVDTVEPPGADTKQAFESAAASDSDEKILE